MFESLESRRLFTSVSLTGGVLTINGGATNDLITVSEDQGEVHVEYSTSSSDLTTNDYSGVTAININGGAGDDSIYYTGNSIGANIHGDGTTDTSGNPGNGHHDRLCDNRGGHDHRDISWHTAIFNKFRCGQSSNGGGLLGLLLSFLSKSKCNGGGNGGGNLADGNDEISVTDAGSGSSSINGDGGNDSITVIVGNQTHVNGGAGDDQFYLNTGVGSYDMTNASTIVDGQDGKDTFTTYAGMNTITGGNGNDTLLDVSGGLATNTVSGVESVTVV